MVAILKYILISSIATYLSKDMIWPSILQSSLENTKRLSIGETLTDI